MMPILRTRLRAGFTAVALLITAFTSIEPLAQDDQTHSLRHHVEASTGDFPLAAFGFALKAEPTLQDFYLERNFAPAWFDAQGTPTPQALAVIEEIGKLINDGLDPADYHYLRLASLSTASPAEQVEYDLLLSDAVANMAQHLLAGKVNPETLTPEWKAQPRRKDLSELLAQIASAQDVAAKLNELRPQQVRYFRLQKLLARLNSEPVPEWKPLTLYPAIKPKATDARVAEIRKRLTYWGDLGEGAVAPTTDGQTYDEQLVASVQNFQRRHGLEEDGVMGRLTLEALNITPAERKQQVINNLERWRWLAEDLGKKHVLVNIAGFELKVIEDNRTVMRKPVIVGRDYRRTPVFSDKIRYLVFNPTWTVPLKIAINDKLPEIRNDPGYLSRMGFSVLDRQQNPVDPASIDWSSLGRGNFPYRLVQAPGPQNALGQVKFMFPNVYDVYLHDTPSRELFDKKDRAFSSGCVRVSDPIGLATWLLQDQGVSREQIDAILAKGELTTLFLMQTVTVHIEYWTAWIDSSSELHFRNDIYERDPVLTAALSVPLYAH